MTHIHVILHTQHTLPAPNSRYTCMGWNPLQMWWFLWQPVREKFSAIRALQEQVVMESVLETAQGS